MPTYKARWEIEVDTEFDSPLEAAERALAIQRDPNSIATFFTVTDTETGEVEGVDLLNHEAACHAAR